MFIRNVFFTFSSEIIIVGANFLAGVILARALSPTDRGIMALIMTVPLLIAVFASFGLPQANIYMIGRKKHTERNMLGNSLLLAIFIGFVTILVFILARDFLFSTVFKDMPENFFLPVLILVLIFLFDYIYTSILRAKQRFGLFNLRRLIPSVLLVLGFLLVLVVIPRGLEGALVAYLVISIFVILMFAVIVSRMVKPRLRIDSKITSDSLRYGSKSYIQIVIGSLTYRLDIVLVAFFLDPEQVAFYSIATSIAEVAWYIPNSVGVVLFPRLSKVPPIEVHQITAKVCRNTLGLTTIMVVLIFLSSWFIVPLVYGSVYRAALSPLMILLPGIIFMALYKVLSRDFTSRDRQQITILASSSALLIIVGLSWFLIPKLGINGAALASSIGYTVAGILLLLFLLREAKMNWRDFIVPRWREIIGHFEWFRTEGIRLYRTI